MAEELGNKLRLAPLTTFLQISSSRPLRESPVFPRFNARSDDVCSANAVFEHAVRGDLTRKSPDADFGLTLAAFAIEGDEIEIARPCVATVCNDLLQHGRLAQIATVIEMKEARPRKQRHPSR